jgi:hypothetical protein
MPGASAAPNGAKAKGRASSRPRRPGRVSGTGGAADAISAAARGLAEELAVEPKGKVPKVPTASEWERWIGKVIYWTSVLYVWWLLEGTNDEGDEQLEQELKLSRTDSEVVARPLAKRIAPTVFNRKWGRAVLDSDDMFEAFMVLGGYALMTRKHLRRRVAMGRIIPGPWNDKPNLEVQHGETVSSGPREGGQGGAGAAPGAFGAGRVPIFDQS